MGNATSSAARPRPERAGDGADDAAGLADDHGDGERRPAGGARAAAAATPARRDFEARVGSASPTIKILNMARQPVRSASLFAGGQHANGEDRTMTAAGILATPKAAYAKRKFKAGKTGFNSSLHHGWSDQMGQFLGDVTAAGGTRVGARAGARGELAKPMTTVSENVASLGDSADRRAITAEAPFYFPKLVKDLIKALEGPYSIKKCLEKFFDRLRNGDISGARDIVSDEVGRNSSSNAFWTELSSLLHGYIMAENSLMSLHFKDNNVTLHSTIETLNTSIAAITRLLDAQIVACTAQERKPLEAAVARGEPWQFGGGTGIEDAGGKRSPVESQLPEDLMKKVRLTLEEKRIVSTDPVKGALEDYATIFSKFSQLIKTRHATCEMYARSATDLTGEPLAALVVNPDWKDQLGFNETLEGSSGHKMLQDLIDYAVAELEALTALAQVRYQISSYSLKGSILALTEARKHVAKLQDVANAAAAAEASGRKSGAPAENETKSPNEAPLKGGSFHASASRKSASQRSNGPGGAGFGLVGPFRTKIGAQSTSLAPTDASADRHFRVAVGYTQHVFNMLVAKATLVFSPVLFLRTRFEARNSKNYLYTKLCNFTKDRKDKAKGAMAVALVLDALQCEEQGANPEALSNAKASKESKFSVGGERRRIQQNCLLPTRTPNGFICNPLDTDKLTLTSVAQLRSNLGIDSKQQSMNILVKDAHAVPLQHTSGEPEDDDDDPDEEEEEFFAPLDGVGGFPIIFSYPPSFKTQDHRASLASIILEPNTDCTTTPLVVAEDGEDMYIVRKIDPTIYLALIYKRGTTDFDQDTKTRGQRFCNEFFEALLMQSSATL